MKSNLQTLKYLFSDNGATKRFALTMGRVGELKPDTEGRTHFSAMVEILPSEEVYEVRTAWAGAGMDAGVFFPLQVGDWVIVGFMDGDLDAGFVLGRISGAAYKIPKEVMSGDTVIRARNPYALWASGDKVSISQRMSDPPPAENVILGQVFKTWAGNLIDKIGEMLEVMATETHISSAPGGVSSPPQQAAKYTMLKTQIMALKTSPIEDDKILSDFFFTEKGEKPDAPDTSDPEQ